MYKPKTLSDCWAILIQARAIVGYTGESVDITVREDGVEVAAIHVAHTGLTWRENRVSDEDAMVELHEAATAHDNRSVGFD